MRFLQISRRLYIRMVTVSPAINSQIQIRTFSRDFQHIFTTVINRGRNQELHVEIISLAA